jgi:membrane protein HdeD
MDGDKSEGQSPVTPPSMSLLVRWLLTVQALCFVAAGLNHAHDIWQGGWLPYGVAPLPINAFWTALAGIDLLAAGLLLSRPRAGVLLALLIMVSDVAVNSYAKYGLGFRGWHTDLSVQLQSLFLGFVAGTAPLVWWSGISRGPRYPR